MQLDNPSRKVKEESSLHQSCHHRLQSQYSVFSTFISEIYLGVQTLQVSVGLSRAHEHDGLPADVSHGDCRANLVINSVKLSKYYSV